MPCILQTRPVVMITVIGPIAVDGLDCGALAHPGGHVGPNSAMHIST